LCPGSITITFPASEPDPAVTRRDGDGVAFLLTVRVGSALDLRAMGVGDNVGDADEDSNVGEADEIAGVFDAAAAGPDDELQAASMAAAHIPPAIAAATLGRRAPRAPGSGLAIHAA
jgi:hypothetical protein